MKKFLLLFLILSGAAFAQQIEYSRARGLFMSVGVGPRIPMGQLSEGLKMGAGIDFAFSYSDNDFLPLFLYAKIGYKHFPGKQSFYQTTDYSSFSCNAVSFDPGLRFFLPSLFQDIVILMPMIEAGASFGYFEKYHHFKIDSGKDSFTEDNFKIGFHVGAGFSMFLMDVLATYNYLPDNQYLSFGLYVRIPIFVKM